LPRFRDIVGFLLRTATPPLLHPNFEGVPIGLARSSTLQIYKCNYDSNVLL